MQIFFNHSKEAHLGRIFDLEGTWGGYNFDFGVHEYQKVENPWFTILKLLITS
jgi:hypothetical protein